MKASLHRAAAPFTEKEAMGILKEIGTIVCLKLSYEIWRNVRNLKGRKSRERGPDAEGSIR